MKNKIGTIIGLLAIITSLILIGIMAKIIIPQIPNHLIIFLISIPIGILFMDFVSGLAHWAGDTWGNEYWPILGKSFIRPFREHHTDQKEITKHNFIKTNINNAIITIPFLILAINLALSDLKSNFLIGSTSLVVALLALFTNQIHKWAHTKRVNRFVRYLQKKRLILSPENHKIHHTKPHTDYYSITNGWTNKLLYKIKFYRLLEYLISKLTGATPRDY